jgi:hypothetical protein
LKRHGKLYPTTFANLFAASRQARRGKRYRDNVLAFEANADSFLKAIEKQHRVKTLATALNKSKKRKGFFFLNFLGTLDKPASHRSHSASAHATKMTRA